MERNRIFFEGTKQHASTIKDRCLLIFSFFGGGGICKRSVMENMNEYLNFLEEIGDM